MIIYGTKAKVIKTSSIDTACESCDKSQHYLHFVQKYFHIFWIPVFPLSKEAILECQHCKKVTGQKEMTVQQKNMVKSKRGDVKAPVYMYLGTLLIAALIGWSVFSINQEEANTQIYIEQPAANDVVIVQAKPDQFKIIKLLSVDADTIRFKLGGYVYKNLRSAKKAISKKTLEESGYFVDETFEVLTSKYREIGIKFVSRNE